MYILIYRRMRIMGLDEIVKKFVEIIFLEGFMVDE